MHCRPLLIRTLKIFFSLYNRIRSKTKGVFHPQAMHNGYFLSYFLFSLLIIIFCPFSASFNKERGALVHFTQYKDQRCQITLFSNQGCCYPLRTEGIHHIIVQTHGKILPTQWNRKKNENYSKNKIKRLMNRVFDRQIVYSNSFSFIFSSSYRHTEALQALYYHHLILFVFKFENKQNKTMGIAKCRYTGDEY